MRTIEIVAYSPQWSDLYRSEAALLQRLLGSSVLHIHHIGSTSVEGLAAKPIIDIMLEVSDLDALDAYNDSLILHGYTPKGENGIPGRRYFQKGGDQRTHHLHAFAQGNSLLRSHLAFRNYLRAHPLIAHQYGELKRHTAEACQGDVEQYVAGKQAFIDGHLARALADPAYVDELDRG